MAQSLKKILEKEKVKPYFVNLMNFLEEKRKQKTIYPSKNQIFDAFLDINLEDVKVVILGQDPYHTKGKACGLAFAVNADQKAPPSLKNIYKEMLNDLGKEPKDLKELKKEGVLLLNTILTVEEGSPLSHKNIGWENFTDQVLKLLWQSNKKIVFLLWGNHAKRKEKELFQGESGHLVLKASHPSPLSARYFFGCKHFSKANAFLKKERGEVDWSKR
jgi:uracil-DNA glycosylase